MKGVIHFHSEYSHDSVNSLDAIIDEAVSNDLDFLILTDHENIEGSIRLKNRVLERGLDIIVPVAAEYKTNYGDVIAAFINKDIKNMDFNSFVNEVRDQKGIIILPHPFEGHSEERLEEIVQKVDLVEIYNPRCTHIQDKKAKDLAIKYGKSTYYGSDAHLKKELCNVIVSIDCEHFEESLKNSLLEKPIRPLIFSKTIYRFITYSQIIKAFKRKSIRIFYRNLIGLIIDSLRQGWNNKVN
tara:strand:+ start:252 stop:974 length:723 start_codon:yes stop_codon:yes gene_type:complete